jgi:Spy/CpxP family protein refolding chaperone
VFFVRFFQAIQFAHRTAISRILMAALSALCLSVLPVQCPAQSAGIVQPAMLQQSAGGIGLAGPAPDIGTLDPSEKQLKALNEQRQKSMVSDTNKLLRMVKELNDEIAATVPDQLTVDEVRKLAAIEKLARSVKEKMGMSMRGAPPFIVPPMPGAH